MFNQSPLHVLVRRWKLIFVLGFIVAVLSAGATFLFPLSYRADAEVLIISQSRYGVDPYTVIKSAERVGENISQIVKTNDFYKKVREQTQYGFDWNYFEELNEREKRKLWTKSVAPAVVYGTGVLHVSTYHPNSDQAERLAWASISALATKGWEYVGGDVIIKVVNEPVVTKWPVRPNIVLNAILGFVVGVLLSGLAVVRR